MKPLDFNHFGHEHLLIPLVLDEGEELHCKACKHLILEPFHGCLSCDYYLHDECLNIPRSILHPSHSDHPLTLLPIPTYPSSSFTCNACQTPGRGFSYGCAHCEFDIHVRCAALPGKVRVVDQHRHELRLAFESAFPDCRKYYGSFKCGICDRPLETDQWRYCCTDCDFGSHLGCLKISPQYMGMGDKATVNSASFDGKSGTAQVVLPDKMTSEGAENGAGELTFSASVAKLVKYL